SFCFSLCSSMTPRPPCPALFPYTALFRSRARQAFQAALNHVCLELAKMIVRDGEGVHRVVTVRVQGARNNAEADAAARAIANSRSEEHTSELQSRENLVCRLLLEKKKNNR